MSLQTDNLAMIALGVLGDQPVSPYQSVLLKGMHVRWGFASDRGFPPHGFHLFRRPARPGSLLCLSAVTGGLKPGSLGKQQHSSAIGRLSSDANLVLTDEFTPSAQAELALDGRGYLRFDLPEGEPARRVDLRIGFRAACLDAATLCSASGVGAAGAPPTGPAPGVPVFRANPLASQGLAFTVKDDGGKPVAQTRFDSVATTQGQLVGLACGYGLTIVLPTPGNAVQLLVTHTLSTAKIEAFDGANQRVASTSTQGPANQPESIDLNGQGIVRIEIRTLRNTAFLHRICFPGKGPREGKAGLTVTAFSGGTPVQAVTVNGPPGQIVSTTVRGDAITAVEVGPGPAALVDLCYVPVAQEATQGWEALRGFPYPMGLPVTQADYPCSVAAPASLAAQRVHYAYPPEWGAGSFGQLHQQLVELVRGGPSAAPMADRVFAAPTLVPNPPDPDPPKLSTFYLLDMMLLGALHPALAQLVGVYWVDQTAAPNTAYDYLVVADHTGVGERSAAKCLEAIQASGFAQLDGFIVFDRRVQAAPPLPPPGAPEAYELPGGTFPDAQGQLPQSSNVAGLRWDVGWDAEGALLPERAVMYLVWRAGLGNAAAPAPAGSYALVTKLPSNGKPKPVMVAESRLPSGSVPQRPPGWPAVPLHYIDRDLPDGWYSWQVSGIDLFGRHSANGPPAVLRVLDRIPPPIPTGVEAYALDPRDPYLQKDAAYNAWYAGLDPAVRETLVGLRVRWRWTPAHQRQAPDTAEFRIYLHPGADLLPDRDQAVSWQHRWFAVGYGSNVTVDPQNGDRVYEVLLPPAPGSPDPQPPPLPLNPSLTEPVVYAHVGVSAADDKLHTGDTRTAGGLANRPGNEGRVGPPAKIYRVLRDLPAAPAALLNDERYYASPADYHDRSFFTYRWKPEPQLKLHVFRALDDALFQADWARRPAAAPLDASDAGLFPPGWNQAGRQQVADALNHVDTFVPPAGATGEQVADAAAQAMAYYEGLSDAALRVLAGLPTSESAFVQLTIDPLVPADHPNLLGPDDPDGFVVDPNHRAFVDTLDGRGTNRYFYRAALIDEAHNLGPLGPSSPPVYLRKVVPPLTPVLTRIRGGERQIELRWVRSGDADVSAYRVYRTSEAANTRDIRLMEMMEELPAAALSVNQNEVSWTDATARAGTDYHYRLTALDSETRPNESPPSKAVVGRAVDTVPPSAPVLISAEWVLRANSMNMEYPWPESGDLPPVLVPAIRITLQSVAENVLISRRSESELTWRVVGSANGQGQPRSFLDMEADPRLVALYRAHAISETSMVSSYSAIVAVPPPTPPTHSSPE